MSRVLYNFVDTG